MSVDFALILVVATALTGFVWLLDIAWLGRRRARSLELARSTREIGGRIEVERPVPWYVDFSKSFFPVILFVLVLRSFVVEPFRIPSESMMPTLLAGDFVLVNKFSYGLRLPVLNTKFLSVGEPQRGDVVVFRYPEDPSINYIKRIVGLPGDHLHMLNRQLYVNGKPVPLDGPVEPPYDVDPGPGYAVFREDLGEGGHVVQLRDPRLQAPYWPYSSDNVVPEGHYFALGDNRHNSRDSRYWGALPEENLIGKAFLIWLNLDCITGNGHCGRIGSSIE